MMSQQRIKLNILGISYSPLKSGAFALLLAQEDGPYRIPVVIGASEAQSIAISIEGIITPRPITHDLFTSFSHAFGIELMEVFIYKFEDGIFSSQLTFFDGEKEVCLDSRTSDAIAIAIRMGAPIYTTREIMEQTGTIFEGESEMASEEATAVEYEDMPDDELRAALNRMIEEENYEEASRISEILKSREDGETELPY